ncbi:hypothetical protein Tco_0424770 [Tanacetum coccineum]
MSKVLQERGFGRLPSSTEANPRDQSRTLIYETRQTTILFLSRLNGYYCEEKKGSYRPQFLEAYSEASHIIPRKEKDLGSFTLPCFINNVCFDNALRNTPKNGSQRNMFPGALLHNTIAQVMRERPLTVSFEGKS